MESLLFVDQNLHDIKHMADNKLMSTAPTVHWTLTFCIALCSLDLLGSVDFDERGHALETDDVGE